VERGTLEIDAAAAQYHHRSLVASSGGPLVLQLGGVHLCSRSLRWRNPVAVLLINPLLIARWAACHRVHIVHARSRCLAIAALVARWLLRPRRVYVVVTWHGFYSGHSRWRRALNGLLLRADRLILPSRAVARHLRQQYPEAAQAGEAARWRVVWRGVEVQAWGGTEQAEQAAEATEAAGTAEAAGVEVVEEAASGAARERVVLCVGRISATKGQDMLLEAMPTLGRPLHAILLGDCEGGGAGDAGGVGGGGGGLRSWRQLLLAALRHAAPRPRSYRALLLAAAAGARVRGVRVSLLPHGNTACVAAHYAAADVVVVPSRRPEAFGRVMVEAIAAGRLVVAYHHGAAGELAALLWAHGAEGGGGADVFPAVVLSPGVLLLGAVLLVAPCDTRGLACAIAAALDIPAAERQRRTRAAQAAVRARLGLRAFAARTFEVYAELDTGR